MSHIGITTGGTAVSINIRPLEPRKSEWTNNTLENAYAHSPLEPRQMHDIVIFRKNTLLIDLALAKQVYLNYPQQDYLGYID